MIRIFFFFFGIFIFLPFSSESPSLQVLSSHVTLLVPAHTPEAFVHEVSNVQHIPAERSEVLQADTPNSSTQTVSPKQGDTPKSPEKTIPPKEGEILNSPLKTILRKQGNTLKLSAKTILPKEGDTPKSLEDTIQPIEGNLQSSQSPNAYCDCVLVDGTV
uniref:Glycosylation-dependent cell adhesion molecule 1 n=1 Tax=Balaenoptera musculus TaxID=9771 RepID=A0A8C0D3S5_BALMU